ncbi:hypothetical protein Syun_001599 [Stephania yunnanensis]|uniref:Retrotransposon gag domain-containing protein n=1 Tax=Stephania yunnanensis TaxID=152371 RepID=A0AAP0LJR9_9MAGN
MVNYHHLAAIGGILRRLTSCSSTNHRAIAPAAPAVLAVELEPLEGAAGPRDHLFHRPGRGRVGPRRRDFQPHRIHQAVCLILIRKMNPQITQIALHITPTLTTALHITHTPSTTAQTTRSKLISYSSMDIYTSKTFLIGYKTSRFFFDYMDVTKERQVKLIAYKLRGGAAAWWEQLQCNRRHEGKHLVRAWPKMCRLLRGRFLPVDFDRILYHQYLQCGSRRRRHPRSSI